MLKGTRDALEQIKQNNSNYANGNPFGATSETRYRPDSGTPKQGGNHDKGQLDYFDDPKRGQRVHFSKEKLESRKVQRKSDVTREEIERIKDDIAELLDFKDKGIQTTPFRLMEQVNSLDKEVKNLRSALLIAETIQSKVDSLFAAKWIIENFDEQIGKAYEARDELNSQCRTLEAILKEYRHDYEKTYSLEEKIEDIRSSNEGIKLGIRIWKRELADNFLKFTNDLAKADERLKSLEKLPSDINRIEESIRSLQKGISTLGTQKAPGKTLGIRGPRLESRIESVEKSIVFLQASVRNIESVLNSSEKNTDFVQKQISALKSSLVADMPSFQSNNSGRYDSTMRTILNRLAGIEKRLDLIEEKIK